VLAHQTQMHNLITLINYQTRLALYSEATKNRETGRAPESLSDAAREHYERPAEELLRYLLFTNEAPISESIKGDSRFAEEFQSRGS